MKAGMPGAKPKAGYGLIVLGLVSILLGWLAALSVVGGMLVYSGFGLVIAGGMVSGRITTLICGVLVAVAGLYLLMLVAGPALNWTLEALGIRDDEGPIVIEP